MKYILTRENKVENSWQPDQQKSPLNWFLLLWISLIYIQYALERLVEIAQTGDITSSIAPAIAHLLGDNTVKSPARALDDIITGTFLVLIIFTLLMVLHGILHWIVLFKRRSQRFLWPYFLLQTLCICLIYFVSGSNNELVMGLCLTLAIEALILLKQRNQIIVLTVGYLLLGLAFEGQYMLTLLQNGQTTKALAFTPKLLNALVNGATFIPFVCTSAILYMQQTRAYQRNQALLHELETAHIQLEDYAARVEDLTLTTERQRMARELHDTLVQGLVGLTMQLETINSLLLKQRCEQARTIVQQATTRARTTITTARAVITDLRTETPPTVDIRVAIQAEAEHFTAATGIPCTCELPTKLPGEYYEHLLRLISEGLTNIARHAQASQVWIKAGAAHAVLTLEIGDNGIGFEPALITGGHYGLLGLRERARLMNGQLLLCSEPGKGTTIRLSLPWERGGEDEG